jgi:hypothetical protein
MILSLMQAVGETPHAPAAATQLMILFMRLIPSLFVP